MYVTCNGSDVHAIKKTSGFHNPLILGSSDLCSAEVYSIYAAINKQSITLCRQSMFKLRFRFKFNCIFFAEAQRQSSR